jgi:hypothetical protein
MRARWTGEAQDQRRQYAEDSGNSSHEKPDATLSLTEGSVAVGIGFSWGKGTLSYKGKTFPVNVEGQVTPA